MFLHLCVILLGGGFLACITWPGGSSSGGSASKGGWADPPGLHTGGVQTSPPPTWDTTGYGQCIYWNVFLLLNSFSNTKANKKGGGCLHFLKIYLEEPFASLALYKYVSLIHFFPLLKWRLSLTIFFIRRTRDHVTFQNQASSIFKESKNGKNFLCHWCWKF